jgi:N-acetylglucosamine-6-phosphate deacetylase
VNGKVITPAGVRDDADLLIEDGTILDVAVSHEMSIPAQAQTVDAQGMLIAPGYIDSHIHGSFGYDFSDATVDQILTVLQKLPSVGVTTVLPTIGSSSEQSTFTAMDRLHQAKEKLDQGAAIAGIHLEGPYVNASKRGAQPEQFLHEPDLSQMQAYLERFTGSIKMVTLAPELPGSLAMIALLKDNAVTVSLGHSAATFSEAHKAIALGADRMAHFFNAMSPLHHREPGMVGAGLTFPTISLELVLDGHHVDPHVAALTHKIKGTEKIILVTDATQATGLPEGKYIRPGNREVWVKDGAVRFASGVLAGSVLTMENAVQNSVRFLEVSITEAVQMAATNPAMNLQLSHTGSLVPGKQADFLFLDETYHVQQTFIAGRKVFDRNQKKVKE